MKKLLFLEPLLFCIHFFIFRALFTSLDSYTPLDRSGSLIATIIALFVALFFCLIMLIVVIIEKYRRASLKNTVLVVLYFNCLFHFFWEAFFEYDLFNDQQSFSTSAIITILIYFVFELFLTFYLVNRLYKKV
ncbi:MAG: hypothetical protein WAM46_20745 [Flavobacterium sp.]